MDLEALKQLAQTVTDVAEIQTGEKKENAVLIDFKMVTFSLAGKDYGIDIMYIKEIAKEAGLTELGEIETIRGGIPKKEKVPKYELIMTHTARRTGATLMYLSGMEIYDIMKITGHSTPAMLKKYIKADQLEVVDKIVKKYNYFD